eukprot:scaffold110063_cov55-Attheya_sp.AAC.2
MMKQLFEENNMEFDSDDELIQTSLSVRDQMHGMQHLLRQVQHTQVTMADLKAQAELGRGDTQHTGVDSQSISYNGTKAATNTLQADKGIAAQGPPC